MGNCHRDGPVAWVGSGGSRDCDAQRITRSQGVLVSPNADTAHLQAMLATYLGLLGHPRYPKPVLLMQVGNRWECQGPATTEIPAAFRRTSTCRKGLPPTWSVEAGRVNALNRQLTRQRQAWCEVWESGYLPNGKKRRQLVALWPFAPPGQSPLQPPATQPARQIDKET